MLKIIKEICIIISTIATVVIAVVAWHFQSTIAEESNKKDYVQIAATILLNDNKNNDPDLRAWATKIFQSYSPIPLGSVLIDKLQTGQLETKFIMPDAPKELIQYKPLYVNNTNKSNQFIEKASIVSQKQIDMQSIMINNSKLQIIENDKELKRCMEIVDGWQNWYNSLKNTAESQRPK